jgi:hypothetical protein
MTINVEVPIPLNNSVAVLDSREQNVDAGVCPHLWIDGANLVDDDAAPEELADVFLSHVIGYVGQTHHASIRKGHIVSGVFNLSGVSSCE